jgi:hypothetical protein
MATSEHVALLSPEEISTAPVGKYVGSIVIQRTDIFQDQEYLDNVALERLWKYINEPQAPAPGPRPANRDTRFTNILTPGKSFGIELMSKLSRALYGDWDPKNNGHFYRISGIETWYYLRYMSTSNPPNPEAVVEHIRCLVDYLDHTPGKLCVVDFVRFVRANSGWVRDKEVSHSIVNCQSL